VPPRLTLGTFLDVLGKPSWALNVLRGKRKSFGNLEGRIPNAGSLSTLSQWIAGQFDPTLSWKDVEWVKKALGREADPEGHPRRRGREDRRLERR